MSTSVRRGYSPDDEQDFSGAKLETMKRAAKDMSFLLNRGYPVKSAVTFIGNHYLLSNRQRTALMRFAASDNAIAARISKKENPEILSGETVNIDGFNEIITLEVALSGSPILRCMDGTFRDLAGLRGTYRLIGKTDAAIRAIISTLKKYSVKSAVFWLDKPVSNSGRLRQRITEIAQPFEIYVELADNPDKILSNLPNVVTGDSVILNRCESWFNLSEEIIPYIPGAWIVDLLDNA